MARYTNRYTYEDYESTPDPPKKDPLSKTAQADPPPTPRRTTSPKRKKQSPFNLVPINANPPRKEDQTKLNSNVKSITKNNNKNKKLNNNNKYNNDNNDDNEPAIMHFSKELKTKSQATIKGILNSPRSYMGSFQVLAVLTLVMLYFAMPNISAKMKMSNEINQLKSSLDQIVETVQSAEKDCIAATGDFYSIRDSVPDMPDLYEEDMISYDDSTRDQMEDLY